MRKAVIPRSIYDTLSADGQRVAVNLASDTEEADTSWAPDWDQESTSTEHLQTPIPKL